MNTYIEKINYYSKYYNEYKLNKYLSKNNNILIGKGNNKKNNKNNENNVIIDLNSIIDSNDNYEFIIDYIINDNVKQIKKKYDDNIKFNITNKYICTKTNTKTKTKTNTDCNISINDIKSNTKIYKNSHNLYNSIINISIINKENNEINNYIFDNDYKLIQLKNTVKVKDLYNDIYNLIKSESIIYIKINEITYNNNNTDLIKNIELNNLNSKNEILVKTNKTEVKHETNMRLGYESNTTTKKINKQDEYKMTLYKYGNNYIIRYEDKYKIGSETSSA